MPRLRTELLVAPLVLLASPAAAQSGEHRWSGLVSDIFVLGNEAWSAEDGGRIRHRNPSDGKWSFQSTSTDVKDTLHRIHFLSNGLNGWAVGQGGWVLKTTNGGATWTTDPTQRIANPFPANGQPYEELYDIHFLNANEGWLVGLHSFLMTSNGGTSWSTVFVYDGGQPLSLTNGSIRLFSLDIVQRPDGSRLGLAVCEPGFVLRSIEPALSAWDLVWDINDLCPVDPDDCGLPGSTLVGCECDICSPPEHGPWFEPWDVEISRHATDKLAVLVGGFGAQCGLAFASVNDGVDWSKEFHECTCQFPGICQNCSVNPLYNDDPNNPNDLTRHKKFKTLYGVGIRDDDNTAHAVGYNGQVVVRNPATGVWGDRSVFSPQIPTTPGSMIFPLYGADAAPGTGGSSFALLSGTGGHLRHSTDGGNTWTNAQGPAGEIIGDPYRLGDVSALTNTLGRQVGQFFRIAMSDDGAFHSTDQQPFPAPMAGNLQAITFASDGQHGVAVGDPFTPAGGRSQPKIRYTLDAGAFPWLEDVTIVPDPVVGMDGKGLREVEWSGSSSFWAVGAQGLIVGSSNDGQTWTQYVPANETDFHLFELEGVSYLDITTGVFVGRRPDSLGVVRGAAYQRKDTGSGVTWTQLGLPSNVVGLWDVDIASGVAWAVGVKSAGSGPEGVVLTATWSAGNFGAFSEPLPSPPVFPECKTGAGLEGFPVLNEVEIAPSGAVWVGGACGRVGVRSTSGTWTEVKSQTDAHVVGFSFVPGGTAGFVAGYRSSDTQQCIVRVQ